MPAGLKQIGSVNKAAGTVSVRHPDGTGGTLQPGAPVYQGDMIETGADGSVGVVFVDKSTFSLGPKGRMSMDEMVFDPANPGSGHSTVAALHGAFSFVSGQIAKSTPDAMQVKTPVMTIGVRGTTVAGIAGAEGSPNTITLMRDGSGALGQVTISNAGGSVVLNGESHTIQISSFVQAPPKPSAMSAADIQAMYGGALAAQPLPPANPPENPPPADGGTGQQGGTGEDGPQAAQAADAEGDLAADPTDPGQVVDFINATLGDIQDPDLQLEIADMLGDLSAWTIVYADGAEDDLMNLVLEIMAADMDFMDFLAALEDDLDFDLDLDLDDFDWDHMGVHLEGTAGNDTLDGTDLNDALMGLGGNDTLYGHAGSDALYGDNGNDTLYAGDGDDMMEDGVGADTLYGGAGDDIIVTLRDGSADYYGGGDDSDTLSYAGDTAGTITVTLLDDYTGTVTGGGETDSLHSIENVVGTDVTSSGDTMNGNFMENRFYGGRGDDVLNGGAGDDELYGGDENDALIGGTGDDTLEGGAGLDLFQFLSALNTLGTDTIKDFTSGQDLIQIEDSVSGLATGFMVDGSTYYESVMTAEDFVSTGAVFGSSATAGVFALYDADIGGTRLYVTSDLTAATTGNSYQIAVLADTGLNDVQASDIKAI